MNPDEMMVNVFFNDLEEGAKFVDPQFHPCLKNIIGDQKINHPKDRQRLAQAKNYQWKRIGDILKDQELTIFHKEGEPVRSEDPVQGNISNCYLLSAMSALARKPHLILRIFNTKEVNE